MGGGSGGGMLGGMGGNSSGGMGGNSAICVFKNVGYSAFFFIFQFLSFVFCKERG